MVLDAEWGWWKLDYGRAQITTASVDEALHRGTAQEIRWSARGGMGACTEIKEVCLLRSGVRLCSPKPETAAVSGRLSKFPRGRIDVS